MPFKRVDLQRFEFYDVRCDHCNELLEPVDKEDIEFTGGWNHLQANNALEIKVYGYYGGYFDELILRSDHTDDTRRLIIFCKTCADLLCEKFPCFKKKIDELES